MKKISFLIVAFALVMALYAFRAVEQSGIDALKMLGIPEPLAKDCVWSSFSGGYLSYPHAGDLKKTLKNERTKLVRQIGEFAKAYVSSDDFLKKYLEYREGKKPSPPEPPKLSAELRTTQKEELTKSIQQTEESLKSTPPEQQPAIKEVVEMMKDQLKSLDDPNNPMFTKEMDEMIKQSYAAQTEQHKQDVAEWEKNYPKTPERMVQKWLEDFLAASKGVDFSATVVDNDQGKKVFANQAYESKSSNWKLCYRAGKETVEAGRTFASTWLQELKSRK